MIRHNAHTIVYELGVKSWLITYVIEDSYSTDRRNFIVRGNGPPKYDELDIETREMFDRKDRIYWEIR
jgi:hypothetical protein